MISMPGSLVSDMLPDENGNIMSYADFYRNFKSFNEEMTPDQLKTTSRVIYDSMRETSKRKRRKK